MRNSTPPISTREIRRSCDTHSPEAAYRSEPVTQYQRPKVWRINWTTYGGDISDGCIGGIDRGRSYGILLALGACAECPGSRLINLEQLRIPRLVHALDERQRDTPRIAVDDGCIDQESKAQGKHNGREEAQFGEHHE